MMEMVELDKKHGLFIPTPARRSRVSLATMPARLVLSHSQYKLRLPQDVQEAMNYQGFPR